MWMKRTLASVPKQQGNHHRRVDSHASHGNSKHCRQQNTLFVTPYNHHQDDSDANHVDGVDNVVVMVITCPCRRLRCWYCC